MIQQSDPTKNSQQQHSRQQTGYQLTSKCPHIIYTPQALMMSQGWYHPLLAYPVCPLVGRYNKGQYRIADVQLHCEFICQYNQKSHKYLCGNKEVTVPKFIVQKLRNIPQVIPYNKPKNLKNQPDVHLIHHLPQPSIKLNWIVSFGQIGKDFINYLNHCYIFDQTVFYGDKLNRTTTNLPILAYLPKGSGLCEQQVERGICNTHFRSQYMSIHLKGGAPAFSPNNMRLGVFGMKKVATGWNQNNNKEKQQNQAKNNTQKKKKPKYKKKYQQKKQEYIHVQHEQQDQKQKQEISHQNIQNANQKHQRQEPKKDKQTKNKQQNSEQKQIPGQNSKSQQVFDGLDWDQMQKQLNQQQQQNVVNKTKQMSQPGGKQSNYRKQKQQSSLITHVHFYTAVLLQNDHRVYYHWLVEDQHTKQIVKQLLKHTSTIEQFANQYVNLMGNDDMIQELKRLLKL